MQINWVLAGTTGILDGVVRDKSTKTLLAGANILILKTQMGAAADENGRFVIYNIPAGTYSVRIQMLGYKNALWQNVEIRPDLRTKMNVELEASSIQVDEVIIHAERPQIQKDITGTTYRVGSEEIQQLPITQFQDILGLQAGVTLEGNVRGGKTSEVSYLIDGLPVQDLLAGGLSTNLPNSSIVEMTIQTGGFDAEYGNALSGIVNVITKTGGNEHQVALRLDNDYLQQFGGTQNNKEGEAEITASGPIEQDNMYYFVSANYDLSGTRWWQDFQSSKMTLPVDKSFSGFGKVDFILSPTIRLGLQGIFSQHDWRDYEFSWRFNLDGLPLRQRQTNRVAAVLSQTLSEKSFYTVRLSRHAVTSTIGETNAGVIDPSDIYQYDFYLQYIIDGKRALWSNTSQSIYTIKADYSNQLFGTHLFKTGFEFNFYNISADIDKYEPRKTYFGKPLLDLPQLNFSTKYNYKPRSGSVYIQDKIEAEGGAIISLGLRYDFLDPTASRPAIELIPIRPNEYQTRVTGYVRAKVKQQLSPRIGFAMPLSPSSYLFINYGHYFQYPLFDYLYSGLDVVALQRGASAVMGNPDLDPERTQAWEISVKQILYENLVGSVTYFKKETQNQVDTKTFVPMDSKAAGDFGFAEYVNNPQASSHGIELVLMRNQGEFINGEFSYTYMVAEGLSDRASQGLDMLQWGIKPFTTAFPLSWDQRHTLKLTATIQLPLGLEARLFGIFYTARPYTYYPSLDGFTAKDPTMVFVPNNERMANYKNLDVKFSRAFDLGIGVDSKLIVYVDSRNILHNKTNVKWMDSSGRIGGELNDPSASFIGRRTHVGLRIDMTL